MAKWPILYFCYGEGVNWSLVFEVFAIEIRANPFAPVGSCSFRLKACTTGLGESCPGNAHPATGDPHWGD